MSGIDRRLVVALSVVVVGARWLEPQTPETLAFEVASVRHVQAGELSRRTYMRGGPGTSAPGQFSATSITLHSLLLKAYKLREFELAAPEWLATERYDITAKVPSGTSPDQFLRMIQRLMEERFRFAAHKERQEVNGFALRVGKSGNAVLSAKASPQNRSTAPSDEDYFMRKGKDGFPDIPKNQTEIVTLNGRAKLQGYHITMGKLADLLALELHGPVADRTGVEGEYDFAITWIRTENQRTQNPETDYANSVFEAVGTLGLRLDRAKVGVDRLVVDHVDRTPTEN